MTLSLTKFAAWQECAGNLREVREWLAHIGKTGRSTRDHTDIIRMSPAHCKCPAFTLAGQYRESGQNYWESPKQFNAAIQQVILNHFKELAGEAVALLEKQAAEALVAAESEIQAVQAEITEARIVAGPKEAAQ